MKNKTQLLFCILIIPLMIAGIFKQTMARRASLSVSLNIKKVVANETLVGVFTIKNLSRHKLRSCHMSWASSSTHLSPFDAKNRTSQDDFRYHLWPSSPSFSLATSETLVIDVIDVMQILDSGKYTTYYLVSCQYPGLGASSDINSQQITISE